MVGVGSGVGVSVGAAVSVAVGGTGVRVSVAVGIATTTVFVGGAGGVPAAAAPTGVCVKVGTGVRVGESPRLQLLPTTTNANDAITHHGFTLRRCLLSLSRPHLPPLCSSTNVTCPLLEITWKSS